MSEGSVAASTRSCCGGTAPRSLSRAATQSVLSPSCPLGICCVFRLLREKASGGEQIPVGAELSSAVGGVFGGTDGGSSLPYASARFLFFPCTGDDLVASLPGSIFTLFADADVRATAAFDASMDFIMPYTAGSIPLDSMAVQVQEGGGCGDDGSGTGSCGDDGARTGEGVIPASARFLRQRYSLRSMEQAPRADNNFAADSSSSVESTGSTRELLDGLPHSTGQGQPVGEQRKKNPRFQPLMDSGNPVNRKPDLPFDLGWK